MYKYGPALDLLKDENADLNEKINVCCSNKYISFLINYQTFNGSPIPFIGPKWNDIDFNNDYIHLRYVPHDNKFNKSGINLVGFCNNINFDYYPEIVIFGETKDQLINLIVDATTSAGYLTNKSNDNVTDLFKNLDDFIQNIFF